jgi:TonB family protein
VSALTQELAMNSYLHRETTENPSPTTPTAHFELTLLPARSLSQRLFAELRFVGQRFRQQWPEFREHPVQVIKRELKLMTFALTRKLRRPQTALGVAASLLLVTSLAAVIVVLDNRAANRSHSSDSNDPDLVATILLPTTAADTSDPGVGAGEQGRVGFDRGRGEGSRPEPARSQGGGGGGDRSRLSASQGRPPAPSDIPAPIPTVAAKLPQSLPLAGIDLDPALYRKLDYSQYGDPRSKSTTPSNGSGEGGGVGTGKGTGIGEGDGDGFGPGNDGNIGGDRKKRGGGGIGGSDGNNPEPDDRRRIYKSPEVSTRPRVISKPEPQYTEQARRDGTTGTVVLRVVFSSTGQVINIVAVQTLGNGLTEKAIAAARQIRFHPATRNGQPVSMFVQLEYNFNLY